MSVSLTLFYLEATTCCLHTTPFTSLYKISSTDTNYSIVHSPDGEQKWLERPGGYAEQQQVELPVAREARTGRGLVERDNSQHNRVVQRHRRTDCREPTRRQWHRRRRE